MLVAVHTCITFLVNVPGCGKGYLGKQYRLLLRHIALKYSNLGPGGLDDHGKYFNCTGGVTGFIDRSVFGNHIYSHPACQKVYENTVYFDPEGK